MADDDNDANETAPNYDFPIRRTVTHNDDVLKSRAQKEVLRLPRGEFAKATGKRRRRQTDEFGFIINQKDSYLTRMRHRTEVENFRLPRQEFTRRRVYKDSDGNSYSPALESDELYQALLNHNQVDKIDVNGSHPGFPMKKPIDVVAEDGTRGEMYGKVLLFSELKPDGKLHKWPAGEVELVNPLNDQYFTGQVASSLFRGKSKGGYVVLKDVVGWGQLSDPKEFPQKKKNKK